MSSPPVRSWRSRAIACERSRPAQRQAVKRFCRLSATRFVQSSGNGVTLLPFDGWYTHSFAWARRPLHEAGLQ